MYIAYNMEFVPFIIYAASGEACRPTRIKRTEIIKCMCSKILMATIILRLVDMVSACHAYMCTIIMYGFLFNQLTI